MKIVLNVTSDIVILTSICVAIIFIMMINLDKPGLYYDDAAHPSVALQILKGDPVSRYWSVGTIEILDHTLPIWGDYEGTVSTYSLIPFFVLFGTTVEALRIYGIVIVILSTIFTYLFTKEIFNEKIGLLSAALFAFMPSVILLGKIPTTVNFIMCFLAISSLYFFIKWKKTDSIKYLILGFLAIGFGISTKITFWWIPLTLIASLILFKPKLKWNFHKITLSVISLVGGSFIFLIMLIKYYYWFIPFIFSRIYSTPQGSSNSTFIQNLLERIGNFNDLLNGSNFGWTGGSHQNLIFTIFFSISLFGVIILNIRKKSINRKRVVFFIFFIFFIIIMSTVTISTRNFWQLLLLLPYPQIIMALFIIQFSSKIAEIMRSNIISHLIVISISAFLIIGNIIVIYNYEKDLEITGGVGQFSSKISELVDYLKEKKFDNIVALDWGFTRQIYFLSDGKIIPKENVVYPGQNLDVFTKDLQESIKNPDTIYIKYYEDATVKGTSDKLKEIISKNNKTIVPLKTFKDSNGRDLYYVFRIE